MPEVGRIYFEGQHGYVAQATYRRHVLLRAPILAWGGQRWEQTRKLLTGEWVYRATEAPGSRDLPDDDALADLCSEGDERYARPSDLPPPPDLHREALEGLDAALVALESHDAELVKGIQALIAGKRVFFAYNTAGERLHVWEPSGALTPDDIEGTPV